MRFLTSPAKRISLIGCIIGLGLLAVSFARFFVNDYNTVFAATRHYAWNDQPYDAAKTSRLITVDAECARLIVADAYNRWKLSHTDEVEAMSPLPPLGSPSFIPNSHRQVIEGESSNGWYDLGFIDVDEETLGKVQAGCLRYAPVYAHLSWVETRSDLGQWIRRGSPRPVLGFGMFVVSLIGIIGWWEAAARWVAYGRFERPNKEPFSHNESAAKSRLIAGEAADTDA